MAEQLICSSRILNCWKSKVHKLCACPKFIWKVFLCLNNGPFYPLSNVPWINVKLFQCIWLWTSLYMWVSPDKKKRKHCHNLPFLGLDVSLLNWSLMRQRSSIKSYNDLPDISIWFLRESSSNQEDRALLHYTQDRALKPLPCYRISFWLKTIKWRHD